MARHSGSVGLTASALSARRIHAGNVTNEHISQGVTAEDREHLLAEHRASLSDPGLQRRAEARLLTHSLFDALRTRDPRRLQFTKFRPTLVPAVAADLWENLGGRPRGKELMEACRAG